MTKKEALVALAAGEKITHVYFSSHEYTSLLDDGHYVCEDGCVIKEEDFWKYRTGEYWDTDWSIWEGKQSLKTS